MNTGMSIYKRELVSFFATPVAYVFIFIFLAMAGVFAFLLGGFYERGQADLSVFFNYHPWLYLFLVPAIAMRTWSEERKSGTIELLMTLPVSTFTLVLAKFFAAWTVLGVALLCTFPIWLSVTYLGAPDHGVIAAAYLGSWLMSGAFLAVSTSMSATTKNQVVAFILAISINFILVLSGSNIVLDVFQTWVSTAWLDLIASLSFLTHFDDMAKGVIALNDLIFYALTILFWLLVSYVVIEAKKAD